MGIEELRKFLEGFELLELVAGPKNCVGLHTRFTSL
jgi:hypothetical protein